MPALSDLLNDLQEDSQRVQSGFSSDLHDASVAILQTARSVGAQEKALNDWLGKYQPCIFGKAAVHNAPRLVEYCIISEPDVDQGDSHVETLIQQHRDEWWEHAEHGLRSAFIILLASPTTLFAKADSNMEALAVRLTELYLQRPIEPDEIYHDKIWLNDGQEDLLEWKVGANFFAAAADGTWWHDHRIPGGLGLSMNSVGHMVGSAHLHNRSTQLSQELAKGVSSGPPAKFSTLEAAHLFAMLTIDQASTKAPDTPATWLKQTPEHEKEALAKGCPIPTLPTKLEGKDYREYGGLYHTDHTIPRPYFAGTRSRPPGTTAHDLDFRYLFKTSEDDHTLMGIGRRTHDRR